MIKLGIKRKSVKPLIKSEATKLTTFTYKNKINAPTKFLKRNLSDFTNAAIGFLTPFTMAGAKNSVKIIRAIEVCKLLGKPISAVAGKKEPEYDVDWIGLNPPDRAVLYDRVNKRVDEMMACGLVEETENLLAKHGRINNFVNTIGYQEILEYLDGKISLEAAVEKIKQNTRHYAKRQLTWFRRNKLIKWMEV